MKTDHTALLLPLSRPQAKSWKLPRVIESRVQLSRSEILRCRVRYFSDEAVFGSAEFVNSVFNTNRDRYGLNRKSGARKMKGADWGNCVCYVISGRM